MAQHKASRRRVLRSSMKHKFSADLLLDTMEELTASIAVAEAKFGASDTSDYVTEAGVTVVDFDAETVGQHKQSARKVIVDKMAHRRLGDEMTDLLEESQVTLNLILAQLDADAGTLSDDATYETFRVADPITVTSVFQGPHKANFEKMMIVAVKHREFGASIAAEMAAIQEGLNRLIDAIQAAN